VLEAEALLPSATLTNAATCAASRYSSSVQRLPVLDERAALCGSGANPACAWHHHGYKHFPAKGVARADTRRGPARYVELSEGEIRDLETETTRHPGFQGGAIPGRTEYLRVLEGTIGWDAGEDASSSFVECSGGPAGSRAYHGRPVHAANLRASALRDAGEQRER
jgi:hypothetical protein